MLHYYYFGLRQGIQFLSSKTLHYTSQYTPKSLISSNIYLEKMSDTAEAANHINHCIISGFDYANNSHLVFQNLAQKSKTYVDGFLKVLTDILTSPDYPPHSKFYAVLLLMKASESDLDTLLTRLTRNRALLDKLFKDAQNDGSKPLEERGRKIFSKTPSPEEAVIGNNYVMLLLEGFKFWSENVRIQDTAQNADPKQSKDPMQIYRVTYARLAEKYTFPEPYLYLNRNYKITEDFHLKPYQTLAKLPVSPSGVPKSKYSNPASPGEDTKVSPTKSNKSSSSSSNPVKDQILACISSGQAYKNNNGIIFKNIQSEAPSYVSFYIKATSDLFLSKQLPPVSQFYILYLLLKTTETRSESLVNALHGNQNLLNELFIQAQTDKSKDLKDRGKTFFSKNPSSDESRLGHNYITLILEALVFWGDSFVPKKNDNKNIFDVIIKTLQAKTKLPQIQQLYYVGYDHDTDSPYLATPFELASGEDLIEIVKATKGTAGGGSSAPTGDDENNPAIRDIRNALEQLDQNKTSLRDVLQNNNSDREIVDLLDYFFADLNNTYDKIVTPKIDPLLLDGPPSSEKYITQVLHEGETVQNIHSEYGAYKNKKLPYSQLRTRVLNLLASQNPIAPERVEKATPGGPSSNWETPGNPALDEEEDENFFKEEERKETTAAAVIIDKSHSSTHKVETVQFNRPNNPVIEERASKTVVEENTKAYRNGAKVQDIHDIEIAESVMTKNPTHKVQAQQLKNLPPLETPISEKQELDSAEFEDHRRQKFYANDLETDQGSATNPRASRNSSFGHQQAFVQPSPTLAQQVYEKPESPKHESPKPVTKEALRESVPVWTSDYKFKAGNELHEDVEDQLKKSVEKSPTKPPADQLLTKPAANQLPTKSAADKLPKKTNDESPPSPRSQSIAQKKSQEKGFSTSLKNTPGRKIDADADEQRQSRLLGSGLKTSTIKPNELSEIENSIRHSFVASGKRPPNFKVLSERQIQEEFEKEISRLKSEKEALHRENIKLENQVKSGDLNNNNNSEQLVQLLSQHQERIEALQEETVGLSEENAKLKRNLAVEKKYNAVVENEDEIRNVLDENYTLQERVKELEKQVNFYKTENENIVNTHRLAASTVQGNEVFGRSTQFGELTGKKSVAMNRGSQVIEKRHRNDILNMPHDNERFETPITDLHEMHDWANMSQSRAHVEQSEYDVEWPATDRKTKVFDTEGDMHRVPHSRFDEEPREAKGVAVDSHNPVFAELEHHIQESPVISDLRVFKTACLKEKCALFENELMRVGVSSTVLLDQNNHKKMLKLIIFFENRSGEVIDEFTTEFSNVVGLSRVAKPGKLHTFIEPGKQAKQQVIVAFDQVPFECLQVSGSVGIGGQQADSFTLFLPTLITKFMEFKPITADVFLERMKWRGGNTYKTEEFVVDSSLIRSPHDFKKYFNHLIDLRSGFGGLFELDVPNAEYLLQINMNADQQVVFQVASFESESRIATFLLQGLIFLFKKN